MLLIWQLIVALFGSWTDDLCFPLSSFCLYPVAMQTICGCCTAFNCTFSCVCTSCLATWEMAYSTPDNFNSVALCRREAAWGWENQNLAIIGAVSSPLSFNLEGTGSVVFCNKVTYIGSLPIASKVLLHVSLQVPFGWLAELQMPFRPGK